MYVEEVSHSINNRNKFIEAGSVSPLPRAHEYYISLFPFEKTILDYVKINGTIKGYKGKHACNYILFDIDRENDLEGARKDALALISHLQSEYGLSPDDLWIWFSGSKGFHIAIINNTFGDLGMRDGMGEAIKRAATELAGPVKLDPVIYEDHRIIRVQNSVNAKTGLYKIEISHEELIINSIDDIKELAKAPRTLERKKARRDIQENALIARVVKSSFLNAENESPIEAGFFAPPEQGNRNNKLFAQACVLFSKTDLHEKSIRELIGSINRATSDPLPDHEVNSIVNSARSRRGEKEKQSLTVVTFSEMWPVFMESLKDTDNKLSMVFPAVDGVFKGKMRSLVGIILGYGGAKKSLYAQNICYKNIAAGNRCLYSNMEMGLSTLTARFIDIATYGYGNALASHHLEKGFREGADISGTVHKMLPLFTDRLLVSSNSNMTAAGYDELITQITADRGRVDILIVDGMSMMGGTGTEMERANEHSKALKELANKWNMLVLPIVHVSRGEDLTTRDLTRRARGSEKIVDNADFFITLSQIKSGSDYLPHRGFYHLWDKRGTGLRVERSWHFDDDALVMVEDNEIYTSITDDF